MELIKCECCGAPINRAKFSDQHAKSVMAKWEIKKDMPNRLMNDSYVRLLIGPIKKLYLMILQLLFYGTTAQKLL